MKKWERLKNRGREILLGELIVFFLAFLWYDSWKWVLVLQLLLIPYAFFLRERRSKLLHKQYQKGFHDFLQSMLPSLQAGYSLENACLAAQEEMEQMLGQDNDFVQKLYQLTCGIEVHVPVEELFDELYRQTGNEDIHQFAVVLEILKTMGGNSVEILRNSMVRIQKKMETTQEIETLLSGKIYEKNLMLFMPFFMILYLRVANPGYLDALYHTLAGQLVMTGILGGILGCFYWTEHIMKISF